MDSSAIIALSGLATDAGRPFFIVQYVPDDIEWEMRVYPINELARIVIAKRTWMDESEYISFLYKLRGRSAPDEPILHDSSEENVVDNSAMPENGDLEESKLVVSPAVK